MCDYSLVGLPNRLAVEGETLAAHRYQTGSKGLGPVSAPCHGIWEMVNSLLRPVPLPVVCIPPGSQLLTNIPALLQAELGVGEEEEVIFREVDAVAHRYRGAVRFASGTEVLLQHLPPGQRVRVLRLDSAQSLLPDVEESLRGLQEPISR
jgi:hypothetical protein